LGQNDEDLIFFESTESQFKPPKKKEI
jgi:hypothetical protein